jgi:mannan endo-1,4-beta-mannosidase
MKRISRRTLFVLSLMITGIVLIACSGDGKQNSDEVMNTPSEASGVTTTPIPTAVPIPTTATVPSPTVEAAADETASLGFYVDGTKLNDANGNEFIMRGINQEYTWFKSYNFIALDAIAATGANTVRLVLADGQQWQQDYMLYVKKLIEDCKERKLIAILEVHDATGSNSAEDLNKAVDYWISIKKALMGNEDYVIVNIANEWYGNLGGQEWANAYIAAIPKLRDAGITNTILVDSAGWGQNAKSVIDYGTQIFAADPLMNTMFAIHMYGTAGKNADTIKDNIDGIINNNLCVTIGEFGYEHSDGDVDEAYLMKYCQEIGVGYLGWSWKGNGGGVEYLDIATEWDGSKLSSDWGENLVNGENGIRATSKICSVFE